MPLIFSRRWCMPSPETFTMPPVKKLLERYVGDGIGWFDPFAVMRTLFRTGQG